MAHTERRGEERREEEWRGDVHTGLWWGHPSERNHLEDLGFNGKIYRN